jgi:hypothetical protein
MGHPVDGQRYVWRRNQNALKGASMACGLQKHANHKGARRAPLPSLNHKTTENTEDTETPRYAQHDIIVEPRTADKHR